MPPTLAATRRRRSALVLGVVPSLTWAVARSLSLAGHRVWMLGPQGCSPLALLPSLPYERWRELSSRCDDRLAPTSLAVVDRLCAVHALDWVMPADLLTSTLLAEQGATLRGPRVVPLPRRALLHRLHDARRFARELDALGLAVPPATLAAGKPVSAAFVARGGSVLRQLAFDRPARGLRRHFVAPRLAEAVARIVRATGYEGIGELEARYDAARDALSVSALRPCFSASVLYATHAGANFADFLLRADDLAPVAQLFVNHAPVALSPLERAVAIALHATTRR